MSKLIAAVLAAALTAVVMLALPATAAPGQSRATTEKTRVIQLHCSPYRDSHIRKVVGVICRWHNHGRSSHILLGCGIWTGSHMHANCREVITVPAGEHF